MEKEQRMQKTTQRFLHLSFPTIKDAGMRGGKDRNNTNELEVVSHHPHLCCTL